MTASHSKPSKFAEAEKSSCTLICIAAMMLTLQWTYQIITERWNKNCQTPTQLAKKMVKTKSSPENEVGSIDLVVLSNSKGFRSDYDVRVRF